MIDAATRRLVRKRAGYRCEYCGMPQAQQSFPFFHVDHFIPQQHGGTDEPSNLALSCYHCNLQVVLENNNEPLTPLLAEGLPLFRVLLAPRQEVVLGSCLWTGSGEPGSATAQSVHPSLW